jgi:hypothetical protein
LPFGAYYIIVHDINPTGFSIARDMKCSGRRALRDVL